MLNVAIYTICLNEYRNAESWFESCQDADSITVLDTGSTDLTLPKFDTLFLGNPSRQITSASINPWRFDYAHNTALALVPPNADVCIPLHLDERLMPGWRDALEEKWEPDVTTKCFYTYVFSHNPDGTPELQFQQNRIHQRFGYRWKYPDHEGIYPDIRTKEVTASIPDLRIEQFQDRQKNRTGTLERLMYAVAEYPHDPRMAHYYGRELYYYGRYRDAIPHLQRYITMQQPEFPYEHAENARILGECWRALAGS